ncbi:probable low affinity copper uptake protein 2 [Diachasma alloeum]|uniref:probable low affinity copper uptake protein 2 n=1 Tax=Diachasma alloeum TaxID=454923 RepID=UPI00073847D5|nr:probable low affinity copper uptake protein 2 [Diachasma alloeum]
MHMWFWFGTQLSPFLLPGYNVTTTWGVVATCLGLIALAITYEAMKTFQIKMHQMNKAALAASGSSASENSSLLYHLVPVGLTGNRGYRCQALCRWLMEVFHYTVHVTLGYIMMLAAMTFNGYIFLALVAGAAVGYHIFGPTLLALNISEVRRRYEDVPCESECTGGNLETSEGGSQQSTIPAIEEPGISEVNADVHIQY